MYESTLVFAQSEASATELLSGARTLSKHVTLVTSHPNIHGADHTFLYPETAGSAAVVDSISDCIVQQGPTLVLCESSADGRLVAGYVAAKLHTSPLCDVSALQCRDAEIETQRLVYGGSAVQTQTAPLPAVLVMSPGVFAAAALPEKTPQSDLLPQMNPNIKVIEIAQSSQQKTVNLPAAKRVIGVGRGLSSPDNLPLVESLAALLGAEIGCTRPVAEEEHWFPKDRYIGVSGCMLKPNIYLAVGISGQVQHMVGVYQSNVIFAIDKNEHAPIFRQADYGLVGDINTVLPALMEALK